MSEFQSKEQNPGLFNSRVIKKATPSFQTLIEELEAVVFEKNELQNRERPIPEALLFRPI